MHRTKRNFHAEITPRKNIGKSGGSVKIKTRCWLRIIYELLPVERIFHAKQKIKLPAEGDRAKAYWERFSRIRKKKAIPIERAFHKKIRLDSREGRGLHIFYHREGFRKCFIPREHFCRKGKRETFTKKIKCKELNRNRLSINLTGRLRTFGWFVGNGLDRSVQHYR